MRPQLAVKLPDTAPELFLPGYASAKIDGVRAVILNGRVHSKTLELIPNEWVQYWLGHPSLEGLDGELCVGPPYDSTGDDKVVHRTMSGVMSQGGQPDFMFYVFDYWNGDATSTPFAVRLERLQNAFESPLYAGHPRLQLLGQYHVTDLDALLELQEDHLELGYEGLMLRNPAASYKFGRSTDNPVGATRPAKRDGSPGAPLQEWVMLKLKKFSDGSAYITGAEEMMHNENELDVSALGLAKRSTAKAGMVPAGVLGAFVGKDCTTGGPVRVGTGFTADQRAAYWRDRDSIVGKLIMKYRHFEVGVKDAPRHAVFDSFQHKMDVGEAP